MITSVTDPRHKTQIIDLFTRECSLSVVVGTIAFGMGIDCPDDRQIVLIGLPDDAEGYIQETGHAGHDFAMINYNVNIFLRVWCIMPA